MVNQAQDHIDQQQIGHGAAVSTQLWSTLMNGLNQTMNMSDPNDSSVGQGFREKVLEPDLQNFQQQFENGSERVRNWALATTDQMRREFTKHIAAQEGIRAQAAVDQNVNTEFSYLSKGVNDVPASLPYAIQKLRLDTYSFIDTHAAYIGAEGVAKARAKISVLEGGLTASAFQGMIDKNPEAAQAWYNDPKNEDLIATLNPQHRMVLEHELKSAMLPIEIKRAADSITGPRGTLPIVPDAGGAYNLSAPDEETAKQIVSDYTAQGKNVRVVVGEPTAAHPRDTQAMLGSFIAKAQEIYPNDPVKRDMLITQIKGNVSTAVAAQQGIQNQAHSVVTAAVRPTDGSPPPTSWAELTRDPAVRRAVDNLSPEGANGVNNWLLQNQARAEGKPAQINAKLEQQAFQRMLLPPEDPNAITQRSQIGELAAQGLTVESANKLERKLIDIQSGGKPFMKQVQGVQITARKMLTQSLGAATIAHPELADEAAYRYSEYLDARIQAARKAGDDPRDLFNSSNPGYVLNPSLVASFMPSEAEIKARQAGAVKPARAPAVPAAGTIQGGYRFKGGNPADKANWEKQ